MHSQRTHRIVTATTASSPRRPGRRRVPSASSLLAIGPLLVIGPLLAIGLALGGLDLGVAWSSDPFPGPHPSPGDIEALVEQLGSDSYATRLRARQKLQRLGLGAFDALQSAQYHDDNEIAAAARRLVGGLWVRWSAEGDPPPVRETLDQYGAQSESERASRIERLGELPGYSGFPALARLARYEPSLRLSERAALVLMRQSIADEDLRQRLSRSIRTAVADNDRPAARWLEAYADDLQAGSYDAERWRQLIFGQRQVVEAATSDIATESSVLELVRVTATRAAAGGHDQAALRLAVENVDLIPAELWDLIEACSWALDTGLHPFALELRSLHQDLFDRHPLLLYGAAEAFARSGDEAAAEQLAERALGQDEAFGDGRGPNLAGRERDQWAGARREIGEELISRGLFRWAEREFRRVLDAVDIDSLAGVFIRTRLARMLGELERHEDVVALLEPLVERMEKDDQLSRRLNGAFSTNAVRSEQEFHRGLALVRQGRESAAQAVLERAWELSNPPNIDILIAMHRLDGDDDWKAKVAGILDRAIRMSEADVRNAEIKANQMAQFGFGDDLLVRELNGYAWLVSNTAGDLRKAIRFSRRSLELHPDDPALLDTLARCHFALGELDQAVQVQRQAVRLEPHSPPLLRQLREFETAFEGQAAKPGDAP